MSPQSQGTRVTSGVEIAHRDSPPDFGQINRAVASAQALAALGPPIEGTPWMGSRPSIIDGLPVIGRALLHENLWFNFGHHHIGLSLRSEEHTSELQSLMRISYAVFCLQKK